MAPLWLYIQHAGPKLATYSTGRPISAAVRRGQRGRERVDMPGRLSGCLVPGKDQCGILEVAH